MNCTHCQREVQNGIIENGKAFCDKRCAKEHHYNSQDAIAWAEGYHSYEDMIEHECPGALVNHPDIPRREY